MVSAPENVIKQNNHGKSISTHYFIIFLFYFQITVMLAKLTPPRRVQRKPIPYFMVSFQKFMKRRQGRCRPFGMVDDRFQIYQKESSVLQGTVEVNGKNENILQKKKGLPDFFP